MSLINIKDLSVTLGTPLFSGLNFSLAKGDRVGLVAANGRGKSTLLAVLAGEMDPTQGDVTLARGLRVAHVRQNVPPAQLGLTMHALCLSAMPPEQADYEGWRADVVLDELSVPYELQHSPLSELSGGWQRTAMLAAAWVLEPDVLLLDEPTNHLDLARIGLLQRWLSALPHDLPVILTSHDRAFLDAVTNRTLFLRPERSRHFALPYSQARAALDEADAADERRFTNDLNKAQQLRRQAAKLKNIGINSGSDLLVNKTKQLTERAEKMEAAAKPAHKEQSAGDIRLSNSGTHAKALLALDNVAVEAPGGRPLYQTGKLWIAPGDRVVLLGSNGTGKTRLVRRIHQALAGGDTAIRPAPTLVAGYSDQHLSQLDGFTTPLAVIISQFDGGDQRARGLLAGAGIDIRLQDSPLSALSGGQKARLAMLVLRLTQPNFYLLDEPTNHLDIEGQEALEHELLSQGAACLLVTHDRSFLRNVGTRYWWIDRKRLVEIDDPEAFLDAELASIES